MSQPNRQQFDAIRRELARIGDREHVPLEVLIGAFAFELSVLLSAAPDAYWVTPVLDPDNVTDDEVAAENAWSSRLDALCAAFLPQRAR